jgi:hypothetical protein
VRSGIRLGRELLGGAQADAIGLAQSTINRAGLGDAKLCTAHLRAYIARVGITVADIDLSATFLAHNRAEDPAFIAWGTELDRWLDLDARALIAVGDF